MISRHIWNQIKNITSKELIAALQKDGWIQDFTKSAILVFRHPTGKRVTIHYHPNKTYGEDLLKGLIRDIGWTDEDCKRLKLAKKIG